MYNVIIGHIYFYRFIFVNFTHSENKKQFIVIRYIQKQNNYFFVIIKSLTIDNYIADFFLFLCFFFYHFLRFCSILRWPTRHWPDQSTNESTTRSFYWRSNTRSVWSRRNTRSTTRYESLNFWKRKKCSNVGIWSKSISLHTNTASQLNARILLHDFGYNTCKYLIFV